MKIFRVSADKNQIFSEKKRVFFSLSSRWKEDKEEGGTFLGEVGDDADGSGDSLDALVLLVVLAGRHSPAKNSAIAKPEANAEAERERRSRIKHVQPKKRGRGRQEKMRSRERERQRESSREGSKEILSQPFGRPGRGLYRNPLAALSSLASWPLFLLYMQHL